MSLLLYVSRPSKARARLQSDGGNELSAGYGKKTKVKVKRIAKKK